MKFTLLSNNINAIDGKSFNKDKFPLVPPSI
jgi:cytochrome c oxidase subunit 3